MNVDRDNDDDGATEVQTNFVSSQYFTTITKKSKINNTSSSSHNISREKKNSSNILYYKTRISKYLTVLSSLHLH